jgi:hypothetical protein
MGWSGLDWINLTRDIDQCWANVNTETFNLHKMLRNSGVTELPVASHK